MMRTAGQWVARLRRMSTDLRSQSGIDDLLRQEGLDQHIHELRSLSRLNVVDTLVTMGAPAPRPPSIDPGVARGGPLDTPAAKFDRPKLRPFTWRVDEPLREREYPLAGCDAYGALPDDASIYLPPPAEHAEPAETAAEAPAAEAPAPAHEDAEPPQVAGGEP